MSEIKRNLLIGVGLAAAIAGGAYFALGGTSMLPGQNQNSTTTVGGVSGTGDFTVEPVGVGPPSLNRPIAITAPLSEDVKVVLRNLLEQQIAMLRKEPTRVDLWLQLGTNRKIAGDYEGAIEAWEYVAQVAPKQVSATAHGNLGDLYMYFIKDYPKAETRFQQAIALNPNVIEYYRALFYLYRDIFKDSSKAEAIRAEGIKNNPGTTDLQQLK
ncbi:MAG TPA: tetratricopeptide repeat protein [Candidatus Paceibacterota bacterium]|nr:tetratricopeptide repeat protein [Candidatus Paceibacterota bacterium]